MIPGSGIPGVHVIGQISQGVDASVAGVTLTVSVNPTSLISGVATGGAGVSIAGVTLTVGTSSLLSGVATVGATAPGVILQVVSSIIAGFASGQTGTIRVAGGSAFTRSPHTAPGDVIEVNVSIIAGQARVGHEIAVVENGTSHIVTIFGATDNELCDDDFMMAVVTGDWDPWLIKQREPA